jgi:Spy/CpxP family protein refolding chaperone
MKIGRFLISFLMIAGMACVIGIQVTAQSGGNPEGFGALQVSRILQDLTQDQWQKMNAVLQGAQAERTALRTKLQNARKEAVKAALAKDATEESVKTKVDAVVKIMGEIDML